MSDCSPLTLIPARERPSNRGSVIVEMVSW